MTGSLRFRHVSGAAEQIDAQIGDREFPVAECLVATVVVLADGHELLQHKPAGGAARHQGYEQLDNEILTGRRLYEMADWRGYPPEVAELYGDEATSAEPYALFEPDRGKPLREAAAYIIADEFDAFVASLLTGLCWIGAAGIAHRAISPDTVLWDSQRRQVQITDFSKSTVFGVPRTPVTGLNGWVPKEQKARTCYGTVGPRDDIWAAGRLIYSVRNPGDDPRDRGQITGSELDEMFSGLFDKMLGPPEKRPTAWELLEDGLRRRVSAPSAADGGAWLAAGREQFLQARRRKHPNAAEPAEFNDDIDWQGEQGLGNA